MIPLRCAVKNYEWGKKGSQSMVARLMKQQDPNFVINEDLSYAEVSESNFAESLIMYFVELNVL